MRQDYIRGRIYGRFFTGNIRCKLGANPYMRIDAFLKRLKENIKWALNLKSGFADLSPIRVELKIDSSPVHLSYVVQNPAVGWLTEKDLLNGISYADSCCLSAAIDDEADRIAYFEIGRHIYSEFPLPKTFWTN